MCVLYPLKTVIDCSYVMLGTAVFFTKMMFMHLIFEQ